MARVICESLPRYLPMAMPVVQTLDMETTMVALKKAIASLDMSSLEHSLTSLGSDSSISEQLFSDSVPCLMKSYISAPARSQPVIAQILQKLIKSLGNDTKTIDLIVKNSVSQDARCRTLAISLIPAVSEMTPKLRNCIFSLTLDRVPAVRCAIVKCLSESKLDKPALEALLRNAVNDKADQVKCAAAEVLGSLCPHFVSEYCRLLENPATTKSALQSLPAMVEANGFTPFYEGLIAGGSSDLLAMAVVSAAKFLKSGEEDVALAVAEHLRGNSVFIGHLWEFAGHFEDKTPFLGFLDISGATKWRSRYLVLQQCLNFAETFGSSLVDLAEKFAKDDTAIVRTLSAKLWAQLIGSDSRVAGALERLMTDNWQTRMVVAKVVGTVGITAELEALAYRLSRDEIRNVRFCLASLLLNTEWYDSLFAGTDDEDIQRLRTSQNLGLL